MNDMHGQLAGRAEKRDELAYRPFEATSSLIGYCSRDVRGIADRALKPILA
jgi:hypothetical protein